MISWLHLLYIIPLCTTFGFVACAVLVSGVRADLEQRIYELESKIHSQGENK